MVFNYFEEILKMYLIPWNKLQVIHNRRNVIILRKFLKIFFLSIGTPNKNEHNGKEHSCRPHTGSSPYLD